MISATTDVARKRSRAIAMAWIAARKIPAPAAALTRTTRSITGVATAPTAKVSGAATRKAIAATVAGVNSTRSSSETEQADRGKALCPLVVSHGKLRRLIQ